MPSEANEANVVHYTVPHLPGPSAEESIAMCLNLIADYERDIACYDSELLENVRDMSFADPADKQKVRNRLASRRGEAIQICADLRLRVRALRLALEQQ